MMWSAVARRLQGRTPQPLTGRDPSAYLNVVRGEVTGRFVEALDGAVDDSASAQTILRGPQFAARRTR